ncbi:hypothetical protein QYE76_022951 [Lolium multiflorum]|uniref:Uncharacterized protein n=1 Tax=Lolium multiflorum TaxID=4521 RepID=A0AAD8VSC1_LOLMU|nr:hypothetical protein QYE76_022951 [Lolium multiflorum]
MAAADLGAAERERSKITNQTSNLLKKLGITKKPKAVCFPVKKATQPSNGVSASFVDHLIRGLSAPIHPFLRGLLYVYGAADIPVEALDKVPSNSPSNALSMTLASHQLAQDLLQKGKGAMARIHSMIFPKISQDKTLGQLIDAFAVNTREVIEVYPVPSFVDDSSSALPESDRLQCMRDRVAQMEKDMRNTYALAAIVNKKNELAADTERYALTELHKAAESLNFIALNKTEENKRIQERVHALTQLSSADEVFWREQAKASTVAKFQDRVQQVQRFFDKVYKALRVIWKTMFPLNAVPPIANFDVRI